MTASIVSMPAGSPLSPCAGAHRAFSPRSMRPSPSAYEESPPFSFAACGHRAFGSTHLVRYQQRGEELKVRRSRSEAASMTAKSQARRAPAATEQAARACLRARPHERQMPAGQWLFRGDRAHHRPIAPEGVRRSDVAQALEPDIRPSRSKAAHKMPRKQKPIRWFRRHGSPGQSRGI
jgi:hypothetical protein